MLNSQTLPSKKWLAALGTFLLWILMAALGLLCVLALWEMALTFYVQSLGPVRLGGDFALLAPRGYNQTYWWGVALGQWILSLLAILWTIGVIGGAE